MAPSKALKSPQQEARWAKRKPKNAPRIQPRVWQAQQATILELYDEQDWKLEDVILHMAKVYDFTPTKRQYVHQLQKWEVKKYHKRSSGSFGVGAAQPDPREPPSEPTPFQGSDRLTLAEAPINTVRRIPSGRCLPLPYTESASEDDFDASVSVEQADTVPGACDRDGVLPALNTGNTMMESLPFLISSLSHEQLKVAAHAFFAASDDEMAFQLLHKLHNVSSHDLTLAIMMARSTHAFESTRVAREVLALTACSPSNKSPNSVSYHGPGLLLCLLDIYIENHEGSENQAILHAQQLARDLGAKSEQLQDLTDTLGRSSVPADLAVYQVLKYVKGLAEWDAPDDNATRRLDDPQAANPNRSLKELLDRFHTKCVHTLTHISHRPCLQDCLDWCAEQLAGVEIIPPLLGGISPLQVSPASPQSSPRSLSYSTLSGSALIDWARQYEIFTFLWQQWQRWQQYHRATNDDENSWDKTAESQIGITAAELLCSTCWLIVDTAMAEDYSPSSSSSRSPTPGPSNYLQHSPLSSYGSAPLLRPSSARTTMPFAHSPNTPLYTSIPESHNLPGEPDFDAASGSDQDSDDEDFYDDDDDDDDSLSLLNVARKGVACLQSLDNSELWEQYLDQIGHMSGLVELEPAGEAFKARTLEAFRKCVLDTIRAGVAQDTQAQRENAVEPRGGAERFEINGWSASDMRSETPKSDHMDCSWSK